MIILEDSEEAVNGLAKLIVQEPTFPIWIKQKQKELIENGSMIKDEDYIKNQNNILNKAEDIANKSMWYGFSLHDTFNGDDNGFMLYKVIDNMMVPLEKDFEGGAHSYIRDFYIRDFGYLEKIIEHKKINNLITYDVFDFDKVYSHQYEIGDKEEGNPIDYQHQHRSIRKTFLNLLKEKGINVTEYNDEQVKEFEKNLKSVIV